jgi:UDPglucose--hexose-1-phosphate uridylyltransferase
VVYESKHFVVMVPKASRWSYEMILIPKSHRPNFEYIDEVEINDFSRVLKGALKAYDNLFNKPDRNFWIHTQRYDPYHWHVGFIPHIKVVGGLELGAGIWVSDRASPEQAAAELGREMRLELDGTTINSLAK